MQESAFERLFRIDFCGRESTSLLIDTHCPLSRDLVSAVDSVCDRAEDAESRSLLVIQINGQTDGISGVWPGDVDIHLVTKWERALHRLENIEGIVVACAQHACSMPGLELLLTADYRVVTGD